MQKQNLTDLNAYLFEQLERISDEDMAPEQLEVEINRSKAVTDLASTVISNAALVMKAAEVFDSRKLVDATTEKPKLLE